MGRLEDGLLRWLQRRCDHPGMMVAADVLEGDGDTIQVRYCRRCGAIRRVDAEDRTYVGEWRLPDPDLWR